MPTVTFNGPVIANNAHNVVLREALIHSPVKRRASSTSYYVVDVGIREGEYTTYIGSYNQKTQTIEGAAPTSVLDEDRRGMRLKAGQAVVVRVTSTGTPDTIEGTRVNFRLSRVGGRDGPAKPLVASGADIADENTKSSLATLERQVNTALSEWEEGCQLHDPAVLAPTGTFQGRLQVDSTTQISLQQYGGNWLEINGKTVSIGSDGLSITTSDELVESTGAVGTSKPGTSTLYYVYVHATKGVRLSATAPSLYLGVKYLGADAGANDWRFCGWVYSNGSTQFVDDSTNRHLCNYYNRLAVGVLLNPGYSDGNTLTTYTTASTTWTPANGGTGATGSYIANGEDAVHIYVKSTVNNSTTGETRVGIGDNSSSVAVASGYMQNVTRVGVGASHTSTPAEGYRTAVFLVCVSAGTGSYVADNVRAGNTADPNDGVLIVELMA